MKRKVVLLSVLCCLSVLSGVGVLQADSLTVVPSHEEDLAKKSKFKGPDKTHGVKSVTILGAIDLGKDFKDMAGIKLRARELIIEPGGVVAMHQHDSRPGVAYILEGDIIEHRNDQSGPIVRAVGDVAFEQSGVVHWWENLSRKPVRALVVDIVSPN
ncbi:MAG: cupin domain-containing protein [Gammaproteobacteria bacterium]|nr:cupin domain-containing protein [Gammaproteobacteria bacterium]MDH5799530.1 cupin domain-containing protein [Gammaproteobacteria bacterium]